MEGQRGRTGQGVDGVEISVEGQGSSQPELLMEWTWSVRDHDAPRAFDLGTWDRGAAITEMGEAGLLGEARVSECDVA